IGPEAAARARGDRQGCDVPRLGLVFGDHRPDPRRQLRRIPQLGALPMTVRTDVGTVADLHASATKLTGLTDFGADDYTEALRVLLDSYRDEAGLTELGSKMSRFFLRGTLVARALSEAAWAANPGYVDTPVTRPIFVTGLPRTGTTALHRLLAADPANQGLEMWLTDFPQPRPPRETWDSNPAYQQIDA